METSADTLLLCPTGSRLYGRRKNKTKHIIAGSADDFTVDLKTFMYHAHTAQPQALEAMFTPVTTEDKLAGYRQGFHVSLQVLHESYRERIIVESRNGVKQRRHALRWALNFREAVNNDGRFNPILSEADAQFVKDMADDAENYAHAIREVFPYEISLDEDRIQAAFKSDKTA